MSFQIKSIKFDSPMLKHGVHDGDELLSINGRSVESSEDIWEAFDKNTMRLEFTNPNKGLYHFEVETQDDLGATLVLQNGKEISFAKNSSRMEEGGTDSRKETNGHGEQIKEPNESGAEVLLKALAWIALGALGIGTFSYLGQLGNRDVDIIFIVYATTSLFSILFFMGFIYMLIHFKRHLATIERELILLRKENSSSKETN